MDSLDWTICREFSFSELLQDKEKREPTFTDYFPSSITPDKSAQSEDSNGDNKRPSSSQHFDALRLDDTKKCGAELILTGGNCQSYTRVVSGEAPILAANSSRDVLVRFSEEMPSSTLLENCDSGAQRKATPISDATRSSAWFVIWSQTVLFFLAVILVLCFALKH